MVDKRKNLFIILKMESYDTVNIEKLTDVFIESINKDEPFDKFSSFFSVLSFKRCILIIYSNLTNLISIKGFSKYGNFNPEDFSLNQINSLLNYKNKFIKKSELPIIPFDNAFIYQKNLNDEEIFVICECEEENKSKYDKDIKLLELFSTCYSVQLTKKNIHSEIADSLREGIVAIKEGNILMKNKPGEEIINNLPEIIKDNFYGERVINTSIKGEFKSIYFTRKRLKYVDLFLFEDITEKTKMMNSVIKMKNFHILGELTAGVAHEINNPLQIILGLSQLIDISGKNLDEETKKYIEMIKDSSLRIKKVVEFLSSYMEHTKLLKEDVIFRISKSIKSAYDSVYNLEDIIGIKISYDIKDDFTVKGDFHKVIIAIENLLLNSIDAIRAKGEDGTIIIRAFKDGNNNIVEVEDDGIGIKEENIPKIYDTFFTTKKNGAGLGLGIVRRVMLMHRGSIELVKTGYGKTIFRLKFPIENE